MASAFRNITVKMFLICSVCVLVWGVPSVSAQETYTYVGPLFNVCYGSYQIPAGSFGEGFCASPHHIQGSITTPLSLLQLQNTTITGNDITSFSFSDGGPATIDQSNIRTSVFDLTTNSAGNIKFWDVFLRGQTFAMVTDSLPTQAQDGSFALNAAGNPSTAMDAPGGNSAFENSGQWDGPAPVPTPEPSTLFLFGTGLLGLMGVGLRKKRLGTSTTAPPSPVRSRQKRSFVFTGR